MVIRRIEDVERDKHNEDRERMKKEITEDINDVMGNIFKKKRNKKTPMYYVFLLLKIILFVMLGVLVLNFVLGNIWLLKFFIKSLFFKS